MKDKGRGVNGYVPGCGVCVSKIMDLRRQRWCAWLIWISACIRDVIQVWGESSHGLTDVKGVQKRAMIDSNGGVGPWQNLDGGTQSIGHCAVASG